MARRVDPAAAAEERERILRVASDLLQEEGPDALTNRRVAKAAGTTTMALYSRFGGKGGLLEALVVEGFQALIDGQDAIRDEGPPRYEILALCRRYRQVSLEHRQHYRLMFGSHADWSPGEAARRAGSASLERLGRAMQRAVDEGVLQGDARTLTWQLFATCHGHVAMELSTVGIPEGLDSEAVYMDAVKRLLDAGG